MAEKELSERKELNLDGLAFMVADKFAEKKESTILAAINHYFEGKPWNEEDLSEIAYFNVTTQGVETFYMGEKAMVVFGPVRSTTDIDGNSVICRYHQLIKELYK